jgi:hypothetical protein
MMILEQFKSLNLYIKTRKLCTIEVGGVKVKKNEKKLVLQFEKSFFFTTLFLLLLWLCISKMIRKF